MASLAWKNNRPFIGYLSALLLILSFLKILFYQYNHAYLAGTAGESTSWPVLLNMIKWSLISDIFVLLLVNAPLLFALHAAQLLPARSVNWFIIPAFVLLNSFVVLLNLADVFYYRFHFQRSNADLLYALGRPIRQLFQQHPGMIAGVLTAVLLVLFINWKLLTRFNAAFVSGKRAGSSIVILIGLTLLFLFSKTYFQSAFLPTRPLVELKSHQLITVQNSFHTFLYSLARRHQEVVTRHYMSGEVCDSLMPVRKTLPLTDSVAVKKNIVLFIMESVPYDFFDSLSPYKVNMPFFDGLLRKSRFYNHAFCYSHQSNKGITAILAGIPTFCDVPLYHSAYVNLPKTSIGTELQKIGYESLFCIGDDYDNFGFAKCANWLGLGKYYSKQDIPNYRSLPMHPMGVQDAPVLDFFRQKISSTRNPFLALHFNISTHYPYDIPKDFNKSVPNSYTAPMKSMAYYDQSLGRFFDAASKEPWFSNTLFIFCSDHWLVPDDRKTEFNAISGYRIPVIVYDPLQPEGKTISTPVSQFDLLGTMLQAAGYKDSMISYGTTLPDLPNLNRIVFARANASLYHAIDNRFILGYNSTGNKPEFFIDYLQDPSLQKNLLNSDSLKPEQSRLQKAMEAFLQKGGSHYNGVSIK